MPFEVESTHLDAVKIIHPVVFDDDRGFFMEVYRQDLFANLGITDKPFIQDNHSKSIKGVVRGLHFQHSPYMAKLMRVPVGRALLVAVDIRKGSPTLGQYVMVEASAENKKQLWATAGFARGFHVLSDEAEIQYKCTGIYNPQTEGGIRWNDPELGIEWGIDSPTLSPKDAEAPTLAEWLETPTADFFHYDKNP